LRQKPAIIDMVTDVFHLSFAEKEHLLTASVGEGLLMMENDHQEIKIIASPQEHNLITTNPDELTALEANIPPNTPIQKREMLINLDLNKGFYKKSILAPEEIEYLLKNNYKESRHVPLRSNTHSIYLVKKVGWHLNEHTFLLHAIYEEILRYTNNVKTDETARLDTINPDIIFTNEEGKEVALEIETGSNLEHHKQYLIHKTELLTKQYGNNWHFILTNNNWRKTYTNTFGGFVMLRHHIPRFLKRQFPSKEPQDNVCQLRQSQNTDDKKHQHTQTKNDTGGETGTKNQAVPTKQTQTTNKTEVIQ